ncbi:hypothetical protein XA68_10838 [Ophiocordyceps unilateralis]|uniref:RanBD1 domain-containing protein n=1 Tax=Ophiocordyceps unilateralis TaxID=268505 RepID=A0A2A9P2I2_OPHUN|nr:hypothetical protein XA68_10838 [Ophiocordyceps unilateralis]
MCDDNQRASPKSEPIHTDTGEDAEMRAARRELKQSSISDPSPSARDSSDESSANNKTDTGLAMPPGSVLEVTTEDFADAKNEDSKANASPKKKRAHDQLDADMKAQEDDATSIASTDSAKDRSSRLEPEKKRHRDQEYTDSNPKTVQADTESTTREQKIDVKSCRDKTPGLAEDASEVLATTSRAAADVPSNPDAGTPVEAESSAYPPVKPSTTSHQTAAPPAPKLTFGSNGGVSPFATLSSITNGFATCSSDGFASAFSSTIKPLTSFAALGGQPLQGGKAARPFGAPDSESEDGDEEEQAEPDSLPEEPPRFTSPDKDSDDKRKTRLQKVEVDDGEAGEVTIVSVRAKMFTLDKDAGWKERGAGMLKINVPRVCIDFDEAGAPIPGSLDAAALDIDDKGVADSRGYQMARLIMRQDQTHRVILNTAIVSAMQFQQKASLKSVGVLFTAFEGEEMKPVSITMRMSAANAKVFMRDIEIVQRRLRRN